MFIEYVNNTKEYIDNECSVTLEDLSKKFERK